MRIVVIYSDTFRFDHVAAHGLKAVRTPNLDALARRGADFLRCYTGSFPTAPNRADVYLGRYWFPRGGWSPLPTDEPTLARRLTEVGYVTQWIGDNPHMLKNNAFYHRGFSAAVQVRGQEGDVYFTRLNKPAVKIMPMAKTRYRPQPFGMTLPNLHEWLNEPHYEEDRFCCRTTDLVCRWLQDNYKADKWMLWVEFFDVHEPWDVPEYLWRMYDPHYEGTDMRHPNYGPAGDYTAAELRNLAAHYAGEATLVDKCIGRILRQLEDCGIDHDTVVFFTTDHGIALGEHNRTGKSNIHPTDPRAWPMFEELAHIPLIVYLPAQRPRKLRQYVQPVDITATLLDVAGVGRDGSLDGRSVLGLVRGRSDGWRRDWAISSAYMGRLAGKKPSGVSMLYSGRWAYCPRTERMGAGGMLFDMASDRQQKSNLVRKRPAVASRLRRRLQQLMVQIGTPEEVIRKLIPGT
jgi:arylsulfatase A-like enzyme